MLLVFEVLFYGGACWPNCRSSFKKWKMRREKTTWYNYWSDQYLTCARELLVAWEEFLWHFHWCLFAWPGLPVIQLVNNCNLHTTLTCFNCSASIPSSSDTVRMIFWSSLVRMTFSLWLSDSVSCWWECLLENLRWQKIFHRELNTIEHKIDPTDPIKFTVSQTSTKIINSSKFSVSDCQF